MSTKDIRFKLNYFTLIKLIFVIGFIFGLNEARADDNTIINASSLEYVKEKSTYYAKGNVKIQKANTIIEADSVTYNEETSEVSAEGNVKYDDPELSFTANKIEMNLNEKTGTLYDARIFFKKDNYHISGKKIEKKGEKLYFMPEASFTTCDAPVPAWCFRGKNIEAVVGETLFAKDVTFQIKDIPVLYTPYMWAPVLAERKTGFLMPLIGYSNLRGMHLNVPFFWAITENQDATIALDLHTKRGLGQSIEYRYIFPDDIKGKWWIYHINDTELSKNFYEIKALHDQRSTDKIGGYLNINYINEKDFYREYETNLELRTNRFLESTGEFILPFSSSRAYLLSQYWIDMKDNTTDPAQKLPEAGYVFNRTKIGQFWFSGLTTFSNFWREEEATGRRFDFYPEISYKTGTDLTFLQTIGLRETAYFLDRNPEKNIHREFFEYSGNLNFRLMKKYSSFTHIVEPQLSYDFISDPGKTPPVFDSTDIFKKTSLLQIALLNRFINSSGEFMVMRLSQGYDTYEGDKAFQPVKLEIAIKKPVSLRMETSYDVNTGRLETFNSDFNFGIPALYFNAGQRYNRINEITYYTAGLGLNFMKPFYIDSRIWYDARERETRDITVNLKYIAQCWGISFGFTKRPDETAFSFLFELKGLTRPIKIDTL